MKPGYDSSPSVPAATPNSDAVRLRMFEMTCGNCEHADRGKKMRRSPEQGSASVVASKVVSYLVVVLYAGSDDGVDGELALLVERRRSHCGGYGAGI
jgi:hypothetical protein